MRLASMVDGIKFATSMTWQTTMPHIKQNKNKQTFRTPVPPKFTAGQGVPHQRSGNRDRMPQHETIQAKSTKRNVQQDAMKNKNRRLTESSSQHQWHDERPCRTTSKTRTSKRSGPPCPQSSMLACAWKSRCCVIYVFRLPTSCARFLQHNIEHKGQGEHNHQSASYLRTCTDVANMIPSTVSLNVVKDLWHIHLVNKSARSYAQHSTMKRKQHSTMRVHDCWHLAGKAEKGKGSTVWSRCVRVCGMRASVLVCTCVACQKQIKTIKVHESSLIFTNPDTTTRLIPLILTLFWMESKEIFCIFESRQKWGLVGWVWFLYQDYWELVRISGICFVLTWCT